MVIIGQYSRSVISIRAEVPGYGCSVQLDNPKMETDPSVEVTPRRSAVGNGLE
jgi:hypothetical protein